MKKLKLIMMIIFVFSINSIIYSKEKVNTYEEDCGYVDDSSRKEEASKVLRTDSTDKTSPTVNEGVGR
ncbi:hypothetical protein N9O57_02035 [bacterium]|nr:hypothetical protein [bacterium]